MEAAVFKALQEAFSPNNGLDWTYEIHELVIVDSSGRESTIPARVVEYLLHARRLGFVRRPVKNQRRSKRL
ncbi:unnamed protein product [Tuber melanosporum]|uniref:(Perigord truffle) hypothetical protein n=1 Tax=Tuber melanosporum (strain Mel28) TaxID=656061 RepID=D5GFV1_TUBMM|nr:uncharacterized protein GSTUM_00007099001 [Tuber melanosporum]CAZ83394.1 unnamed protein product [Tuber melanosporum]